MLSILLMFAQGGHSSCGWSYGKELMPGYLGPVYDQIKARSEWHAGEPMYYAGVYYSSVPAISAIRAGTWNTIR